MSVLIFAFILLTRCSLESGGIRYREFMVDSIGGPTELLRDTIDTSHGIKFLNGDKILSSFYLWDSALRKANYADSIFLDDKTFIVIDTLIEVGQGSEAIQLYQYFVHFRSDGGNLATMALHSPSLDLGTVYYEPWDSKKVIRLMKITRLVNDESKEELLSSLQMQIDLMLPQYVPADSSGMDEIDGEIVLDLSEN